MHKINIFSIIVVQNCTYSNVLKIKTNFFSGSEDSNFSILKTIKMFGHTQIKIVRNKGSLRKFIKYCVGIFMSNNAYLIYSIVGYLLKI